MKRALITGIAGQDGSYLAESLLADGYEVHGLVRPGSFEDAEHRLANIAHILDRLTVHEGNIESATAMMSLVERVKPDELYHLAAQSFVSYSLKDDTSVFSANMDGALNVFAAVAESAPDCRLYFAGSSELIGVAESCPQDEHAPKNPRALYGISKLAGYHMLRMFRDQKHLFACCGFLYNHESPRRGYEFVTRKITRTAALIKKGLAHELHLGNLDAKRDWGYAKDYVEAMRLMLRADVPQDYVVATGELHTVREFVSTAFARLDLDWEKYVKVDERFYRPSEAVPLCGDASKIKRELGWKGPSISFSDLVSMMVDEDMRALSR
jgi:GDPmannose 4,6-dehydratase